MYQISPMNWIAIYFMILFLILYIYKNLNLENLNNNMSFINYYKIYVK